MTNAFVEEAAPLSAAEKRARLARRLRRVSEREVEAPLSFAQQRLWFLDQLEPNNPYYNVPAAFWLRGALDVPALEKSLRRIIARHGALRARFANAGDSPVQKIRHDVEFQLRIIDAKDPAGAELWAREEVRRPFNLAGADPLLRAALARVAPNLHLLVLNLHHIAADEWSLKILFRELEEHYEVEIQGRDAHLADLPIQYTDFALWQHQHFDDPSLRDQLDYWTKRLSDAPPMTELMTDRPRGRVATFAGNTISRPLDVSLMSRLKQLANANNASLFAVVLSGFNALVHRYTGLEDIVVGTPVAGRNRLETEGLIGFFVNTLLMRSKLDGDPTFQEFLGRVRDDAFNACAHQDLPFEKLVEALRPERSTSHLAFTRIMFSLQTRTADAAPLSLAGLRADRLEMDTGTAKFDLTMVVQDFHPQPALLVEYNTDLFDAATMERLLEHFENLLAAAAGNPAQRVSELPLMGEKERRKLLVEWNDNATNYPKGECIHRLFEERARECPDNIAVVFGQETWTYSQLNERANRLAHCLIRQDFAPGTPVAICVERSAFMVAGFLAILKAGGAYVPLDPRHPKERLAFMLEDTRASILLTQHSLLRCLPRRGIKTLCLDDETAMQTQSGENLTNRAAPDDIAYIIYTSGSTGQPKGVAVPHRAVNRLVIATNYINLDETDRIAQVSNISFDAATFEIWGALLNGGQLRGIARDITLSPSDFAKELRDQGITAMFLTSALFSQVAAEIPDAFATMRTLIAGGEALDPKWVRAVIKETPSLRLVNGYGPTENTTFTCCCLLRSVSENATSVPIGRPIANTQVYILDKCGQPVPVGVPGELYAGGDGLARGYWNRPQLTADKFVLHQFEKDGPCVCLYRTGDLARYLPDGNIEFLGRSDDQVKMRGFRVELGEIEAELGRHQDVKECTVKVAGSGAGQTRLVAYCVPKGKRTPRTAELRRFLSDRLPDYMMPSAFVVLKSLPLTANGKVDRRALPEPDGARPALEKKYATPRDAIELELAGIWESILGIEPIGIEDQFFDLGGHSLMALRVVSRIEKSFGIKLPLATVFTSPTIEKLAAVIRDEMRDDNSAAGSSLVEIQPKGTKPPLFLVHGVGGGMFWGYVNLSRRLGADQPVFGFSSGSLQGNRDFHTVEQMAAQYIADMRVVQPRGPYHLGGYCFGGVVAAEMARQLESQGEKVAMVALLNCAPPNSKYLRASWTPAWCVAFARNLLYWVNYCRQWTPAQRADFIRWKRNGLKAWFSRRLGGPSENVPAPEGEALVDLSSLPEEQQAMWRAHIRALMKYRPQPYRGRVHLFRSPGHPLWCSFDAGYGWGEFVEGGVAIAVVPGTHERILEPPWVDKTAEAIKSALEKCREDDLTFWKGDLAGAPTVVELPSDFPRPSVRTKKTGTETRLLPRNLLAQKEEPESFILVLAALNIVLERYIGQDDILIGAQAPKTQDPANIVVVRTSLAGNPNGQALLNRVRAAVLAAWRHRALPFGEVVAQLCPSPDPSCHPLVQIFLTREPGRAPIGFDLSLCLTKNGADAAVRADYATDLFISSTVQRMLGHLETALKQLVSAPQRPLAELSLLTAAESELILNQWNRTERLYPRDKTLIQLFEEQVARTPAAQALVCGVKRLTYRELFDHASGMAKRLRTFGVGKEDRVGICLERSEDMAAGILGTLLAGGAYVPLDPAYPKARLDFIVRDSRLKVVLTRRGLRNLMAGSGASVLCVEDLGKVEEQALPGYVSGPSDLAYVLYTSGSTGQPKGVALEHRNAVALISWARETFSSEEISGVLASTSICFDLSVFELFVPLCCGGKVILADNALALPGLPASEEVTLINTVPSAMSALLGVGGVPGSVRVVNLAGEPLATALVEQIYQETSAAKVYDLYGPTETTTYSTFTLRKPGESPTIGRPLSNEQVYILDKYLQPMPVGVPGDLYISGAGVARGYFNRPDLTNERFLAHPFQPGARLYKTGDIAKWRTDGNLVFLGRSDHQVKIRGFRIELGEIESALKSHSALAEAVVTVREDRPGERRLAAYVVTAHGQQVDQSELKSVVRERLPEYMTPSYITFLPKLPLTPNGKVDRKALPAPTEPADTSTEGFVAPCAGLEEQVAAVWREVLGLEKIGVTDNFFELGGHSLLAMQVIARLRKSLRAELPFSCLFEAPTVRALAAGFQAGRWQSAGGAPPPLEPVPGARLLPASFMQEQLWFLQELEPASDVYNVSAAIRLKGRLDVKALKSSFDMIVERHEALRTTFHLADGHLTQRAASSWNSEMALVLPDGEENINELIEEEARQSFDLTRGPLMRVRLFRLTETDHALLIAMHHAVTDGWSMDVLFRELEADYRAIAAGSPAPQRALPIQYMDYADWQRRWMQGEKLEAELRYWKEKLAGAPLAIKLPYDFQAQTPPSARAARTTVVLPQEMREALIRLGQREGATPFTVLMTALAITLRKWTEQSDLVIGTVVAGRSRPEIEGLIGCFMNFLPLRAKVPETGTALDLLRSIRSVVIEAQTHQDCPFEKIVSSLAVERRPGANPLYNVGFLYQPAPSAPQFGQGLDCGFINLQGGAAPLDLRIEANETPTGLALDCEYKTDLFQRETIDVFLASFQAVLAALGREPLTSLTDFALDPALAEQARKARARVQSRTIVISSTFTAQPVEEPLRYWLDELQTPDEIQFAPFQQVFQQLLDPSSLMARNRHGLNVVLVRLEDWQSRDAKSNRIGSTAFYEGIKKNAAEFVRALHTSVTRGGGPILVCFCPASRRVTAGAPALQALEDSLTADLAGVSGVHVATSRELAAWYPVADYDDPAGEELGCVPYTPVFFTALAAMIARKWHTLQKPACKVIALDADQTLWAGVCGEDGPKGIVVDEPRLALQNFMRRQSEQGRLLVLCSKNSEEDVAAVFEQGPPMPLKRAHFTAWRVNWQRKSENLKSLARELKLGLDSFVFIDDNPAECGEVETNCPEAITLQLPEDPALIPTYLEHCWIFDQATTTEEDKARTEMYRQNRLREEFQERSMTYADFISGLELHVEIAPPTREQLGRVAQLTQRTNQFNVSGRRRTEAELCSLNGGSRILGVSVRDRFGDYGLVGAMIVKHQGEAVVVDSMLLSCRALGRGVEHRMLASLGKMALEDGAQWVDVPYERLPRNQPALDFLTSVDSPSGKSSNGHRSFRFPARTVAEVRLDPSQIEEARQAEAPTAASGPRDLTRYGAIALRSRDVAGTHALIEARRGRSASRKAGYAPPETEMQRKLCELWQNVLRVEAVGITDDFFGLGGHSLLAVRLFSELEKMTGRKLPLVTIFQSPTIAQLANVLGQQEAAGLQSVLVPIQPCGNKPPLFLIHGAGGDVLWGYANLVAHTDPDQPVYAIKSRGQTGQEEFERLEDMAAYYLKAVREHQPRGPYYLGGYCFGGNVACEIARQLLEAGEQVALVALLDSAPANAGYETVRWWRPDFAAHFALNAGYWLRDFRVLKSRDRWRFVVRKARSSARRLARWAGLKSSPEDVDLEDVIDPTRFPDKELELWKIHLRALNRYVQQPYPGRVTLFRTKGHPLFSSFADDFCWGRLAADGVSVKLIPGSHESIFMEPHVKCLAQELTLSLNESQARQEAKRGASPT